MTVDPPSQSVEVTQTVKFITKVSGIGKENFSYQWRHNGVHINGETGDTLIIDGVTKDYNGNYECVVKNEYGDSATSDASVLSQLNNINCILTIYLLSDKACNCCSPKESRGHFSD